MDKGRVAAGGLALGDIRRVEVGEGVLAVTEVSAYAAALKAEVGCALAASRERCLAAVVQCSVARCSGGGERSATGGGRRGGQCGGSLWQLDPGHWVNMGGGRWRARCTTTPGRGRGGAEGRWGNEGFVVIAIFECDVGGALIGESQVDRVGINGTQVGLCVIERQEATRVPWEAFARGALIVYGEVVSDRYGAVNFAHEKVVTGV